MKITHLGFVAALMCGTVTGCGGCGGNNGSQRINAGGSSFVDPIMQKWAGEYRQARKVEIDYIKKGSGYGITQMTDRMLEFGCTDAPMSQEETDKAKANGGEVIHIPVTMGAVAVVYNLPDVKTQLKLSGPVLAEIFTRKITKWNHKSIVDLNPGVTLPDADIAPVCRAESSGTTNVFTEYLHKANPTAYPKNLVSKKPKWTDGIISQEGSDGVTSHVKANANCISYVEVLYARKNNLTYALVQNKAGQFVAPDAENVTAAAVEAVKEKQTDSYALHQLTYSLTNPDGAKSYPIGAMTYAVLYQQQKPEAKAMVEFLKWVVSDGQKFSGELEYAPLPAELTEKAKARLDSVTFK